MAKLDIQCPGDILDHHVQLLLQNNMDCPTGAVVLGVISDNLRHLK